MGETMQVHDVQVSKIEAQTGHELSDNFFRVCVFCEKLMRITPANFDSCIRLGGGRFYCPFCLRNNHHHRSSRNVLILSYRSIIGYYYYRFYEATPQRMYLSEIEAMIEKHQKLGLQNPTFSYDPHTYLWFIDFNRIGNDKHKAPFDEIKDTAKAMYETFDLKTKLSPYVETQMWDRFEKAITLFYEKRKRPRDKRMLIPTMSKLINNEKDAFMETTREFIRNNLVLK